MSRTIELLSTGESAQTTTMIALASLALGNSKAVQGAKRSKLTEAAHTTSTRLAHHTVSGRVAGAWVPQRTVPGQCLWCEFARLVWLRTSHTHDTISEHGRQI